MTLSLLDSGRNFAGIESYVFRPMITALIAGEADPEAVAVAGGRVVTRAKKLMSFFILGHGNVPSLPIPSLRMPGFVGVVMGVVATTRVRGGSFAGILGLAMLVVISKKCAAFQWYSQWFHGCV